MFIKKDEILENMSDSQNGKKVVSISIAKELENKLNLLFSNNSSLISALDSYTLKYIKDKLGITSNFPITNPELNKLYLYNNKIYKLIGNSNIKKMITGVRGNFILLENGTVYYCGQNSNGEGGFDATGVKKIHTKVPFSTEILPNEDKIIDISFSDYTTHFLTDKGNIIICGQNTEGSLGNGTITQQTVKAKLSFSFPSKVKKIIVGGTLNKPSTFYLLEDGKIYACGCNGYGQLCTGDKINKNTPVDITSKFPSKIINISVGGYTTNGGSSIFLTEDNKIFTCGYNAQGQLGNGTTTEALNPVPITIEKDKKVTHIASGGGVISYVLNNTELYSCGYNTNGCIGNGNNDNLKNFELIKTFNIDIKDIKHYSSAAGETFSVVLLVDGSVYTTGYNSAGQLGKGHTTNTSYYSKINCDQPIKEIGLSYRGLHLLTYNGEILVFGNNDQYQLGTGTTDTVINMYNYSVFIPEKNIKINYQKPDEDFIQIL